MEGTDIASRDPLSALRNHPLWRLTAARLLETIREPETVFWIFGFPLLLALVLGIAFRSSAPPANRVAVVGGAAAPVVAHILDVQADLDASVLPLEEASRSLRVGKVDLLVRIEGEEGGVPAPERLVWRYDPARAEGRSARAVALEALTRARAPQPVSLREEKVSEPGSRYIDFLVPGLVGMNLMSGGMWGVGYAVVSMRTRKLLKRFAATPMRRSDFLLSILFSRMLLLVLEVAVLIGFGQLVFGVPVRGSWLALGLIILTGTFAFTGLSLLIAARARTVEAASGWMNLVQMPMYLLSGAFFSYERFPEFFHPAIRLLPLTMINDSLRSIMNEGTGLSEHLLVNGGLFGWGLVCMLVSLRIFRWQ